MSASQILIDGYAVSTDVDTNGVHTLKTQAATTSADAPPANVTPTIVAAAAANTVLLAADTTRLLTVITNNTTSAILYVAYGRAASASVWDELLYAGDRLQTDWQGAINGFWASATGDAHVAAFKA